MRVLLICINREERTFEHSWRVAVCYPDCEEFMNSNGISFELLSELGTLGLIKFDPVAGFVATGTDYHKTVVYINGNVMETVSDNEKGFPIENVLLTEAGQALQRLARLMDMRVHLKTIWKGKMLG